MLICEGMFRLNSKKFIILVHLIVNFHMLLIYLFLKQSFMFYFLLKLYYILLISFTLLL